MKKTYTEKQLQKIDTLSINQIDIANLDPADVYLIKVELGNANFEQMKHTIESLKSKLKSVGIYKVLFIPIRHGKCNVEFYKLQEQKSIKND